FHHTRTYAADPCAAAHSDRDADGATERGLYGRRAVRQLEVRAFGPKCRGTAGLLFRPLFREGNRHCIAAQILLEQAAHYEGLHASRTLRLDLVARGEEIRRMVAGFHRLRRKLDLPRPGRRAL